MGRFADRSILMAVLDHSVDRRQSASVFGERGRSLTSHCFSAKGQPSVIAMRIHPSVRPVRARFDTKLILRRPARAAFSTTVDAAPSQSTINQHEIAHFSKLSALWWDEQGEFQMLHRMNPVRMKFIREKMVSASPVMTLHVRFM